MSAQQIRWMPRLNWPDYLFRIAVGYPDAVGWVNHYCATQHGRRLLW